MMIDTVEAENGNLLHAKTGAAWARARFGVTDAVYNAVLWHTTARPDMTLLEKILYIADYAEPTRRYGWAAELRELIETDLDRAVLRGLEITIEHTAREGNPIHYRTLEARDWLLAHGGRG